MKKIIFTLSAIALMAACSKPVDKETELESLKKQEAEIKSKIAIIEAELSAKDSTQKGVSVTVEVLKAQIFKNYIDVQGRVDADENVALSSEIPGTITRINVKVGDEVRTGQVLAETDARAIIQQISDLQTNMELVNQVFEKQKNLWEQKIGTEIQFLQAKTNKESMEKKMGSLQEQLRMTKIISPINGNVDAIDIKVGQAVAPGMAAIRVINFANLKVKADVAETYSSKVKKGSDAILYFPDMNDSVLGKVNFVSRSINSASRTFQVEVLLDNKKEYHPNMVVRVNLNDYQSTAPTIVIPVRTIQKDENNQEFVFIAEDGVAKKRLIKLGNEYSGKAEVLEGLKENDKLVTLGYNIINEGDAIAY
jgi:membrane fusion protein, multidrug efflux system